MYVCIRQTQRFQVISILSQKFRPLLSFLDFLKKLTKSTIKFSIQIGAKLTVYQTSNRPVRPCFKFIKKINEYSKLM